MDGLHLRLYATLVTLWRRRWIMIGLAWLICLLGWAFIAVIPDRYEVTARIYVDTDTLLSPLMKGISVDVNMNRQADVMRQTLLSRPNLEKVLALTRFDFAAKTPEELDKAIQKLQIGIKVQPQGKEVFSISFLHRNAVKAKDIVQSLLTVFVETNLGSRRQDVVQARRFIEGQIEQYERQMKVAEQQLATFKRDHLLELPQTGNHAAQLEKAKMESRQLASQLDGARTRLALMRHQLAATPQFVDIDAPAPVVIAGRSIELELRIAEQQKNLDLFTSRYTESHPDVVAARRSLKALQDEYEQEIRNPSRPEPMPRTIKQRVRNALYEQLQLKAVETESELRTLERRLSDQNFEVDRLNRVAFSVPNVEAEFKSLDRDYQVMRKNYDELLQRREQVRLAQEVHEKAEKTQYRLVDPPIVPQIPSSPNRPLLMTFVLAVALGASGLVALGLGQLDDSFSTTQQVRQALAYPVIGGITLLLSTAQRRRRMVANASLTALVAFLFISYGGVLFLLTRSTGTVG